MMTMMLRASFSRHLCSLSTRKPFLSGFRPPPLSPFSTSSSSSITSADVDECLHVDPIPPVAKLSSIPVLLQPRVIIYDGVCHLCHRGVKWVIKADKHKRLKFCCLQSRAAEPYLRACGVEREDVLRRFLFIEGPECYDGSTAALKVASYLPFPYSTLGALWIVPAPLRDAIYDYVAKRRYAWFGKEEKCIIMQQDRELLDRFIDRDEILGGGHDAEDETF